VEASSFRLARLSQSVRGEPTVEARLRQLLRVRGRLTFAEFMDVALYDPDGGYYVRIGPGRDYRTAPQHSPAFGHLIGRLLATMWRRLGAPSAFVVVELGAGDLALAGDATAYLRAREPSAATATRYLGLDRCVSIAGRTPGRPDRVQAGEESTADQPKAPASAGSTGLPGRASLGPHRVMADARAPPLRPGFVGCVLANELFDALPVHRLLGRPEGPGELWVVEREGRLAFEAGELSSPALGDLAGGLRPGQLLDLAPAAGAVVGALAGALGRGYLLTVDYGGAADELRAGHRMDGTLVAYHRHRAHERVLDRPGEQDLTAHVDFSALRAAGERSGLRTAAELSLRELLLRLGLEDWLGRLDPARLSPADLFNARARAAELVAPGGLGKLRVLLQTKDAADPV
jgi:SAM-dependent MidA family methyltransferase